MAQSNAGSGLPLGWVPSRFSAAKIALAYCVLGCAWIYFSGTLAARMVSDPAVLETVEKLKGWFFVLVTTFLLWVSLDRYFARIRTSALRLGESEQELERTNRLYAALSALNQAIVRLNTREELFAEVTRALVNLGKFDAAWVGRHNPETHQVEVAAKCGDRHGFLGRVKVYADDRPEGRGTAGTAIREGRPDCCQDFSEDPRMKPWQEAAAETTWRSAAAFPIRVGGKVWGALIVYSHVPGFFQTREMELLDEAALDVSFAMDQLEAETRRAEAEAHAQRWLRLFQVAEFGLAYARSSDNVFIEVNPAFAAQRGYTPGELVGRPFLVVYAPEEREAMESRLPVLDKQGHLLYESIHVRKDGTRFPVLMEVTVIRDNEGNPVSRVAYALDITDLRKAQEELREADLRLRMAAGAGNVGLWDWDLQTNRVYFSREWKSQIGCAEHEITNELREWETRVHPDDLERCKRTVWAFIEKPWDGYQLEFRFRHKDGSYRWILSQASLLRDAQGKAVRMLGSHVDITQNRRREALLEGQREVLERIAAGAPLGQSLTRLLEVIEAQSPGMLTSILLLDPSRLTLRHVAAPSLPETFTRAIDGKPIGPQAASCGTAAYRREPVFTRNVADDPLWADYWQLAYAHGLVSCWSTPILDDTGGLLGTIGIYSRTPGLPDDEQQQLVRLATHIAAICIKREQDENALRESERRLRFALEGANEGIWEVHLPSGHFYLSPRGCRILGYEPEELDGNVRRWDELVHPDDVPAALHALQKHLAAGEPSFAFEQRVRMKSGAWKWLMCRGKAIELDEAGRPVRVTGTHADITERKQMEEELQQLSMRLLQAQDEERRRLARELHDSTAQHLAALTLNLANLRRLTTGISPQAESLCSDSNMLASQAADEIRNLSYLLHPPLLEATGLIGAVEDYAQGFSERTGIKMRVEAPPDFGRLSPEAELALFRVVQESLANVLRHSGSQQARIRFTRGPHHITLEVQDSGKGIAAERLDRIQRMHGGAGVGLAGMRERLRLVGGHFQIESGPGGTLLRAVAPLETPAAARLNWG